ncbi:CARDB domain-containing protein [Halobaculum marinum]|uniref:CARDB domain-containing protein n=1 Tax=Halobaculum marinum TaxID=3031996 RepID=A0ABD5WZN4_9EURY|nr:CARDB domain-containing protein [Halobaculum sp. DT55]
MHLRSLLVVAACALLLTQTGAAPALAAPPAPVTDAPAAVGEAAAATAVDGDAGPEESLAASPAGSPVAPAATTATTSHDIGLRTTLALTPETPGSVRVTLRFDVPDRVSGLETTLADGAENVALDGFAAAGDATYEWDGETSTPTITYRMAANRTSQSATFDPDADLDTDSGATPTPTGGTDALADAATAEGRYLFVDTGPWALVTVPSPGVAWRYRGDAVGLSRTATTAGPGAVGSRIAFLGEHTVHERTAHGQTFRLVVPAAADGMAAEPAAVLESLSAASDTLRVGDRDESVFLVAAPADVSWAVRGIQTGDADAWVRADEPLDTPESPWLHEYVHTRQSFATTAETRWLTEGSADYYAALLALRQGHVDFDEFADHLARGARAPFAGAVLAEPSTWTAGAQYRKGALVAGDLDRRIRLASDDGATLSTVFTRLNAESEPVSGERFATLVATAGDATTADAARRFTRTDAVPEMWSAEAHSAAFATPVARLLVDTPDRIAVDGAYRNTTLSTPATLAVGETVTVPVAVRNVGGAAGDYRVTATADGRRVAVANGTVAAGANATARLSWTPPGPGRYTLTVRDRRYTVVVAEPARPTVTALSTNRTSVAPGDSVLVTAEVTTDGSVPADGAVTVRVDGRAVATERVRVAPNGTATVRVPVTFDAAGEYVVSVGDARASVTVETTAAAADSVGGDASGTAVATPGFGPATTLAALVSSLVVAARLGRRSER